MLKRCLCIWLSLVMILSAFALLPASAGAASYGDITYRVSGFETAEVTGYTGSESELTIPSAFGEYTVTSIGDWAFSGCDTLTSVTLPNTVTTIGEEAFSACASLVSITIPDSVTVIGNSAISRCPSLLSVTVPKSVKAIGDGVFSNCASLTEILVDDQNPVYDDIDGVLFNTSLTTLIRYPGGRAEAYTVPDFVKWIGDGAFYNSRLLTSVTLPKTVTSIGDFAFNNCTALTSVTILNTAAGIGEEALGYYVDSITGSTEKVDGFTLTGYNNSTAEAYAGQNGFAFTSLGEAPVDPPAPPSTGILGDADSDGAVTVFDATYIQRKVAKMGLTNFDPICADVDGDNATTIYDATYIQRWVARMDDPYHIGEPIAS